MMTYAKVLMLVLCLGAGSAVAQTSKDAAKDAVKPAAPAPVAVTPERTTASFGDWIMRCEVPAAPAKRVCEVALTITLQGQTSPVAQVALGKPNPKDGNQLTVVLPPNVALLSKPQVLLAKADAAATDLIWQRCTPGACFASVAVSNEAVARFSGQSEPGTIVFKNAADREIALPMSFRGLAQALEALAKES